MWVNPTGLGLRSDELGSGKFGSLRGDRIHLGQDFICEPGQGIVACTDMQYRRYVQRVYATDPNYHGMEFESDGMLITYFYVDPSINHMEFVKAGQWVALAQNVSAKYGPAMTPHVHVQICFMPYTLIIKGGQWNTQLVYIDPLRYIDPEV